MLKVVVPAVEGFDSDTQTFVNLNSVTLELEHSLVSLSKWESRWGKPFIDKSAKTDTEILDYIRCMCLTPDVSDDVFLHLSDENVKAINAYIDSKQTATWFREDKKASSREVITSELIYYWMFSYSIPKECENWHLNRLITLIRVFGVKNAPAKKLSRSELAEQNRQLNAARQKQYGTRG